jgi:feruloyl esterase
MFLSGFHLSTLYAWVVQLLTVQAISNCSTESFQAILPAGSTALKAFHLPANSTYQDPYELAFNKPTSALPALCLLVVNSTSSPTSSFRFGVFLPDGWNGRFATVGNGGLNGGVNWSTMGVMVKYGFAAISTDTGHNRTIIDGAWALKGKETRIDNAYRALHGSVVLAKDIINKYYSRQISYSYFKDCSIGGRQTFAEMQRYPDDFDGVLAGGPRVGSDQNSQLVHPDGHDQPPKHSCASHPASIVRGRAAGGAETV